MATGLAACHPPRPTGPPSRPPAAPLDLARPRILGAGADLRTVAARVTREPYRTVFTPSGGTPATGTTSRSTTHRSARERIKAKAAKDLAFQYAIDRTIVDGVPAPFRNASDRQAAGDTARTLLLNMYTRSRLAVPAPLGGYDRDINTSEELLQYSTAYDTLLGAGYAFTTADELAIRTRITDLASELYDNYIHPETAGGASVVLPNNHRSKSAAALGVAALALLEAVAGAGRAAGRRPLPRRVARLRARPGRPGPALDVRRAGRRLRRGPVLPALRGPEPAAVRPGLEPRPDGAALGRRRPRDPRSLDQPVVPPDPALDARHDAAQRGARPDRRRQRRLLVLLRCRAHRRPPMPPRSRGAGPTRRRRTTPTAASTSRADSVIAYDDSVVPAPPSGSPTRFYAEGGDAVFRSGWDAGRDRPPSSSASTAPPWSSAATATGSARSHPPPTSSPTPAASRLRAFGERLLLDPGYLTYPRTRPGRQGNRPQHGPRERARVRSTRSTRRSNGSATWPGSPPVDGQATISGTRDTPFLDTARVTSAYAARRWTGASSSSTTATSSSADTLSAAPGQTPTFTWPLHGNGGGTSGGTFAPTPSGGEWTHGARRASTRAVATDAGPVTWSTRDTNHEGTGRVLLTHTDARRRAAPRPGPPRTASSVAYPSRSGEAAPTVETLLDHRRRGRDPHHRSRPATASSSRCTAPTATVAIQRHAPRRDATGPLRRTRASSSGNRDGPASRAGHAGRSASASGPTTADSPRHGPEPLGAAPTRLAVHAAPRRRRVRGRAAPAGTCVRSGARRRGDAARRRRELRARRRRRAPTATTWRSGRSIRLTGRGCDVDRDAAHAALGARRRAARQRLVAHRHRQLEPRRSPVDAAGPYRVRLTVTDGHGGDEPPVDVEISGGPRCTGDRLDLERPALRADRAGTPCPRPRNADRRSDRSVQSDSV